MSDVCASTAAYPNPSAVEKEQDDSDGADGLQGGPRGPRGLRGLCRRQSDGQRQRRDQERHQAEVSRVPLNVSSRRCASTSILW